MVVHVTLGPSAKNAISSRVIARRARAMLRAKGVSSGELSIVLTNDRQIQKLNKIYRKKDRPTDVLSFSMHEGEGGSFAGDLLGDVVIAIPTARRQSMEKGVTLLDEVTELLAHGLLHLLGWDHDTPSKDRRMRRETRRLCGLAVAPERRKRAS